MKNKVIAVLCLATVIMSVGYAAFSTTLNISGTANIASEWKVVFTDIKKVDASSTSGASEVTAPTASGTSATFDVDLQSPGDTIEYEIKVENQGTLNAVITNIVATETGSDALTFEVKNIKIGDKLAKKTDTTFNVVIKYNSNITSQPSITTNTLTIKVDYAQDLNQSINGQGQTPSIVATSLGTRILKDNTILNSNNLNYAASSSDTAGLYSINTNTQNNKETYFFRGNVQNNYVSFGTSKDGKCVYYNPNYGEYQDVSTFNNSTGGFEKVTNESDCLSTKVYIHNSFVSNPVVGFDSVEECTNQMNASFGIGESDGFYCEAATDENANWTTENLTWRIVRINEDGSVRLILDDTIGYGQTFDVDGDTSLDAVALIPSNAPIVTTLTSWYNNNLSKYADSFANSGYCYYNVMYDNGLPGSISHFDNYDRLFEGTLSPQFNCSNRINNANGFGAQVGLITADEAVYAGVCKSGSDTCPSYLYDNLHYMDDTMVITSGFLTMTPIDRGWDATDKISFAGVGMDGLTIVKQSEVSEPMSISGIRPVINLRADLEVLSGNGTAGSPYVIKTN